MLSVMRLWKLLDYDPITGIFRRKIVPTKSRVKVGDVAGGGFPGRYWRIEVDGVRYYAHQLAWFYVYGVWADQLDHIDRNKWNNAIKNLRPATTAQNNANSMARNSFGFKGVFRREKNLRKPYIARICGVHLGYYSTPEEANEAYTRAAKIRYGEFARGK